MKMNVGRKSFRGWLAAGIAAAWGALPGSAAACATCFGQSDAPMARGMNMGIFTLLLVIMSVLMAISCFFFYILRRAARLEALANQSASAPSSLTLPDQRPTH